MSAFTEEQIRRYSRHILLAEVGGKGQRRLRAARVLVLGAGGAAAVAAGYLAAAGVGRLDLVDAASVNQVDVDTSLFLVASDLGRDRAAALRDALLALNPDIAVATPAATEVGGALATCGVAVCGPADFARVAAPGGARVLRPTVGLAAAGARGALAVLLPDGARCPACAATAFGLPPGPAWPPVAGLVGSLAAVEAVKLILGKGEPLRDAVLEHDTLEMTFRRASIVRAPSCTACADQ